MTEWYTHSTNISCCIILVHFRGAYLDFLPGSKAQSDALELTVSEHIGYFYSWCLILSLLTNTTGTVKLNSMCGQFLKALLMCGHI